MVVLDVEVERFCRSLPGVFTFACIMMRKADTRLRPQIDFVLLQPTLLPQFPAIFFRPCTACDRLSMANPEKETLETLDVGESCSNDQNNSSSSNTLLPNMEESALHWHEADTAHLQPTSLLITKAHRAWDRKALSPFARRMARRAITTKAGSANLRVLNPSRRILGAISGIPASPLKPVKKLCTESSFGVAPRVSQWESRDSPVRKIVTRAGAVGHEFVALEEEEDGVEDAEEDIIDRNCGRRWYDEGSRP
nr:hypothetical protein CFP56_37251 [Quercus suber]